MSCFENIEYKEDDFLLLNPLTIDTTSTLECNPDDCLGNTIIIGSKEEIEKGEDNGLQLKSPVIPVANLDCDSESLKVKNNLSEFKTDKLKKEARKNLGIIVDDVLSDTSENLLQNKVITKNIKKNVINNIQILSTPSKQTLQILQGSDTKSVVLPIATNNTPGIITAEDKNKLNTIYNITWTDKSNLNDYIAGGTYNITGFRLNSQDNLPINNLGENSTISAKLFVTVTPEGTTTYRHSIGQTLILTNAEGKETKVYTRNGNRTSTDGGVTYTITWGNWGQLQQNIEVGLVASLDSFTNNGIYSGIWQRGEEFITFVCVVINDYALGVSPRRVSQYVYGINKGSGKIEHITRIAEGDTTVEWERDWHVLNEQYISAAVEGIYEDIQTMQEDIVAEFTKVKNSVSENEKNIANQLFATPAADEVTITGRNEQSKRINFGTDIPAATVEHAGVMTAEDKKEQVKKTPLINGDIIVGQAREVYSRQGKVDSATFLKRTTAGGTSVSDGVATLKQIGGNIIKNMVDSITYNNIVATNLIKDIDRGILTTIDTTKTLIMYGSKETPYAANHYYYCSACIYNKNANSVIVAIKADGTGITTSVTNQWVNVSLRQLVTLTQPIEYRPFILVYYGAGTTVHIKDWTLIDLTEMFGAGKEPTKEECDMLFGTMDALPQGLTIAQPTGLKSTGFNQWNPANVLLNKSIVENAIEDDVADRHIAIFECLPCKTGTGENNGYVIGYGKGDTWSDDGIEVYLTPLNPLEVEGELYMHKLEKDETYGTYVPQIKGYMLVVTPAAQNFCAHFLWSGDREKTDYEEYIESDVALPPIPEMSEWGLAGITMNGAMVHDTIDLENGKYTKRIGAVDMGTLKWQLTSGKSFYAKITGKGGVNVFSSKYTSTKPFYDTFNTIEKTICTNLNDYASILVKDSSYDDADSFKQAMQGVMLYYVLATPEEYPIVTKTAPNYVGSDYGVEEFAGSKVPLVANILFYMRSLVSETRNFLDRLMARLGISDATAVADKIADAIIPAAGETDVEPTEVIEE